MKLFFIILLLLFGLNSVAQKDSVILRGVIMDSTHNETLPFVDIICDTLAPTVPAFRERGMARTDIYGNFTLKIPYNLFQNKKARLYFWYVGYDFRPVVLKSTFLKEKIIVFSSARYATFRDEIKPIDQVPALLFDTAPAKKQKKTKNRK